MAVIKVLMSSALLLYSCNAQDADQLLTLSPLPSNGEREYAVLPNENFTVVCTAMSDDPKVFVLWRRSDGSESSLIINHSTNATNNSAIPNAADSEVNVSASGGSAIPSGASASGIGSGNGGSAIERSASGIGSANSGSSNGSSIEGSTSGVGSASGSGNGDNEHQYAYIVSALLQTSSLDGGIQCSAAGQYECIAGISPQAGSLSINITVEVAGCQLSKIEDVLTYISYIGIPISIASLVLTLISLIIFKNIRQKDISKFHIQLCLALLLMQVTSLAFVVLSAERVDTNYVDCVFVSILVHYSALTSVFWMGAEALLMFHKLIIVFGQITTKYIVIVSIICWSASAVPVVISLIVDLANGNEISKDIMIKRNEYSEKPIYCFLSHPGAYWGAFIAPQVAIIVFNTVIFVCVIVVLVKHLKKSATLKQQSVSKKEIIRLIFSIGGIMFLFGLTSAFFAVLIFLSRRSLQEAFQVMYTIFNSLQGLFIFLFLCMMSSDVRDEWKAFFNIKPQASPSLKKQLDRKLNLNYTTTTGTLETLCKSPVISSTSDSKSKLMEKAIVSVSVPFDDEKDYNDDVFEDDDRKVESDEPNKPKEEKFSPQSQSEEEAKPKEKGYDDDVFEDDNKKEESDEPNKPKEEKPSKSEEKAKQKEEVMEEESNKSA